VAGMYKKEIINISKKISESKINYREDNEVISSCQHRP
jgi:hypothetical protein